MKEQLVKKAKRGHKKSFGLLIESVKMDGYRLAWYYMQNEADSQDVLCQSIEKVYISLHKLKENKRFKQWFLRIVANEAKMVLRQKQNRKVVPLSEAFHAAAKEVNMDLSIDLAKALQDLDEMDRSWVMQKYHEGYTFKEISDIYQVPESTVKTRVYQALRTLRERLEGKVTANVSK